MNWLNKIALFGAFVFGVAEVHSSIQMPKCYADAEVQILDGLVELLSMGEFEIASCCSSSSDVGWTAARLRLLLSK